MGNLCGKFVCSQELRYVSEYIKKAVTGGGWVTGALYLYVFYSLKYSINV